MIRVGQGYDVHRFNEGDHIILGGVKIAYEQGLEAHSDGDVVLHALCDALLGAAALGGQASRLRQMLVPVSKTTALGCTAPLPLR